MTLRILALTAALTFTLSTVAQAQPSGMPPADPALASGQEVAPPPAPRAMEVAPQRKPPGYRTARYDGGQGSTWKTGRDRYGFMGTYGGCRFTGHAGPNGYRLDRSC